MKKLVLAMLLVLVFVCGAAFAELQPGHGTYVARYAELAAFMGSEGCIYISGRQQPVNTVKAERIVSIDPYRIVFLSTDGAVYALEPDSGKEERIAGNVYLACSPEDSVFFVTNAERRKLYRYDFDTAKTTDVYTAEEEIEVLYALSNGVVINTVENSGAYIIDTDTLKVSYYSGAIAAEIERFDGFDVYSDDHRILYVESRGALFPTTVDMNVHDWAVIGKNVYYLAGSSDAVKLKSYNITDGRRTDIANISSNLKRHLTASRTRLFMLSNDNIVYNVDTQTGAMNRFVTLSDINGYAVGGNMHLTGYQPEAVSGQLNVYGICEADDALPTFSFVEFTTTAAEKEGSQVLLSAYVIDGESTVNDLLKPVERAADNSSVTLRKGSRGDAVADIQGPLHDHGYYDYYIDGIFGWRTEQAVRYLQEQMGRTITGAADPALCRIILSGRIPDYDPYMALKRGDIGPRVLEMQIRLRELGYLADNADSIFGIRTEKAVRLFREENGLGSNGIADHKTLELMFSDGAELCSCYIDLQRGDSGWRVRELNERLKKLYYLEGNAGDTYGSATVAAVRRFQEQTGMRVSGKATAAVQERLFARHAPEYDGYITLSRGDRSERVRELKARLKELGYFEGKVDSYYGKSTEAAVRKFQHQIGLKATGTADELTQEELFDPNAPHYIEYEKITEPVIELSAWSSYKDGIYQIADTDTSAGCVTVSYSAYGDVDSYDVEVSDNNGNVYQIAKNVTETIISVPVTMLDPDYIYTVAVTAHPIDKKGDSDTYAELRFARCMEEPEPEPEEKGVINSVTIMPKSGADYTFQSGIYTMNAEDMVFVWTADGEAEGYTYEITDEGDNVLAGVFEISDVSEADASGLDMQDDVIYTLTVSAVPKNCGPEDAVTASVGFRVYTKTDAEIEAAQEQAEQDEAAFENGETVNETGDAEKEASDQQPEEKEIVTLSAPVITVEPVIGSFIGEFNGQETEVLIPGNDSVVFRWPADGASEYHVNITDSNGNTVVDQRVPNDQSALNTAQMTAGVVYRLTVTAFDTDENETSAVCSFGIPKAEEPEIEENTDEEQAEMQAEDAAEEPEEDTEEYSTNEPEQGSEADPESFDAQEELTEDTEDDEPAAEESAPETPDVENEEDLPVEEEQEDISEEAEEPEEAAEEEEAPEENDEAESEGPDISLLQQKLEELGYLEAGVYEYGILDEATVQALITYQQDNGLPLCDPDMPEVNNKTIKALKL